LDLAVVIVALDTIKHFCCFFVFIAWYIAVVSIPLWYILWERDYIFTHVCLSIC